MKSTGELLRERREAFGADLREAARWCGEAPEWLEDKEARSDLSALDFERVCRALAISPAALLRGEGDTPTRSVARFRSALEDSKLLTANDLRLLAAASEIGMALADVLIAQGEAPSFGRHRDLRAPSEDHPELLENLSPLMDGYAAEVVIHALERSAISLGRAKELLASELTL